MRQLSTPSLPQLAVGQQSESLYLTIASSMYEAIIVITADSSVDISPQWSLTIPSNTQSVSFNITGNSIGTYQVKYTVYSKDNYAETEDGFVVIYESNTTSDYFEANDLPWGILDSGCCRNNLSTRDFCPTSVQDISVSSSCSLWSSNNWIRSGGIVFLHSGELDLPLSLLGINSNFDRSSLSVSPLPDSMAAQSCSWCSSDGTDCTNWNMTTNDAQFMAKYHSLLRTFLYSIRSLLPVEASISQVGDTSRNSFSLYNFLASLVSRKDAHKISGCENVQNDIDSPTYVLRSNANLMINVSGSSIVHGGESSDPLCFVLELCRAPQNVLDISLPKTFGQLISTLLVNESLLPESWNIDVVAAKMSVYGVDDNRDLWFWNGSERQLITLPPHNAGISVESGYSSSKEYIRASVDFVGSIDISLQSRDVSFVILLYQKYLLFCADSNEI